MNIIRHILVTFLAKNVSHDEFVDSQTIINLASKF